jgi:hypothetical protein
VVVAVVLDKLVKIQLLVVLLEMVETELPIPYETELLKLVQVAAVVVEVQWHLLEELAEVVTRVASLVLLLATDFPTREAEEAATLKTELRVQEALAWSSSATRWRPQHDYRDLRPERRLDVRR